MQGCQALHPQPPVAQYMGAFFGRMDASSRLPRVATSCRRMSPQVLPTASTLASPFVADRHISAYMIRSGTLPTNCMNLQRLQSGAACKDLPLLLVVETTSSSREGSPLPDPSPHADYPQDMFRGLQQRPLTAGHMASDENLFWPHWSFYCAGIHRVSSERRPAYHASTCRQVWKRLSPHQLVPLDCRTP